MRPDVVNVQWVDDRAWLCARAQLHPLVLSCLGSDINNLWDASPSDQLARIATALNASDMVTADCGDVLDKCRKIAGTALRTSLFYYGIDLNLFRPGYDQEATEYRRRIGIPPDAKTILSVRSLRPLMRHDLVIQAFTKIAADPSVPYSVLLLKRYLPFADTYESKLVEQIEQAGISNRVFWLDEVPYGEMAVQYAVADVVVNYPERDAFPVTFLEAAACKRPLITSSLPAYRGPFVEAFQMVPPCDVSSLAESLKTCLRETQSEQTLRLERAYVLAHQLGSSAITAISITRSFTDAIAACLARH